MENKIGKIKFVYQYTYTLCIISGSNVKNGMIKIPNQNTGDESTIRAWPNIIAPTGITGQTLLYININKNHIAIEPQMAMWLGKVHVLVTRPALKQTAITTYYKITKKNIIMKYTLHLEHDQLL